jgi:hypothetical protein
VSAERPHPGQQLLERERLGQVVIGAGIQAADTVRYRVTRRQHQDRGAHALAAQLAGDLDPIHLGQHDVEHDQVVRAALRAGQAAQAVMSHLDTVANIVESALDHTCDAGVVFDQQNVHARDNSPQNLDPAWSQPSWL